MLMKCWNSRGKCMYLIENNYVDFKKLRKFTNLMVNYSWKKRNIWIVFRHHYSCVYSIYLGLSLWLSLKPTVPWRRCVSRAGPTLTWPSSVRRTGGFRVIASSSLPSPPPRGPWWTSRWGTRSTTATRWSGLSWTISTRVKSLQRFWNPISTAYWRQWKLRLRIRPS